MHGRGGCEVLWTDSVTTIVRLWARMRIVEGVISRDGLEVSQWLSGKNRPASDGL